VRVDRWTVSAVAFLIACCAGAVTAHLTLSSREAYLAADPGVVVLVSGLVVAVGIVLIRWAQSRAADRRIREVGAERDRAREDRRLFLLRLDHELKNPLQAIRAGLALNAPQQSATSPPTGIPAAAGTQTARPGGARALDLQVVRITRLITDLRKLAELEIHPLEAESVELRGLLHEVAAAATHLPGADQRSLRTAIPEAPWPLPPVTGDRDLLFVALHNLLANAVKYSGPGDRIEIRAREDGPEVVIEVADTGAGIPDDEQNLVWDELARGRGARALPGSGLGLSLVRVVTARHGGTTALSSRPGEGTVVTIRLPAAPRRPTAAGASAGDVADLRHRRDSPATPSS
jgi:two-component system OmpR family sensor kinase